MDELKILQRTLDRERRARKAAEELLEQKSYQLYQTNSELRALATNLEEGVQERTTELVIANEQLQQEIHERMHIEHELEAARDQALQASRLKSEFLATMSHEIRTPMNGIMGMTELLLDSELTDEQIEYATVAYEESKRLLSIINDILDFSKIEAGKLILEMVEFSLTELVQSIMKLLVPRAEAKGIALLGHVATELPQTVEGDSVRLRQVLMNLVSNAIKFTHEGEVLIRVAHNKQANSLLPNKDGKPRIWIQIVVRDSGIGMNQQTLHSLFESFVQADSSTTRRYGGTGLGLAICKRLIHLMGGNIEVESELGHGSKFTILLPLTIGSHSLARLQHSPATVDGTVQSPTKVHVGSQSAQSSTLHRHVLLVEDHENNQRVAIARLRTLGYKVTVAENGSIAVNMLLDPHQPFQHQPFQLVLMDWQMPEMDGLEATRRIREAEKWLGTHIPIIGMTANAMKGDREKCLAAGMDDYLSKPINSIELQQVLEQWLG